MDERRAERFLELYRRLEEALKQRGFRNGRSSVVMQFMNTREGSAFKEELISCREMRNRQPPASPMNPNVREATPQR